VLKRTRIGATFKTCVVKTTFKFKINIKRNLLNFKSIQWNHLQAFPIWWDYPYKLVKSGAGVACKLLNFSYKNFKFKTLPEWPAEERRQEVYLAPIFFSPNFKTGSDHFPVNPNWVERNLRKDSPYKLWFTYRNVHFAYELLAKWYKDTKKLPQMWIVCYNVYSSSTHH
jgi:hypothetical protein